MSRRVPFVLVVLLLGGVVVPAPPAGASLVEEQRFVVGFHALPSDVRVGGSWNGGSVYAVNAPLRVLGVASADPLFKVRANADPDVRYVEPDGEYQLALAPADPRFADQYAARQVRLPDAWDVTLGDADAEICFIDSGVRWTHEDLGGARFAGGRDFVEGDDAPQDERGHGTFVVGLAAATVGNGVGIAGAGNVQWSMARVFAADGGAPESRVADALTWCADRPHPRVVVSMSLGGDLFSQAMQEAAQYAAAKGRLLVASAGNRGPCEDCVLFPARFPEVVAVTCTDAQERLCGFSSTGPEAELAAPGDAVLSTCFEGDAAYCEKSGTSASAPVVSGVAALYWSHDPSLSADHLRARLQATARDRGANGHDASFGFGRVDARCVFLQTVPCGPPPNDDFATPEVIRALPYQVLVPTRLATTEPGEPQPCAPVGATTWYAWTAPGSGQAVLSTAGSTFDTVLAVHTGPSLSTLVPVACNDDADGGNRSEVRFAAAAGATYLVQVGGKHGAVGDLRLQAACDGCPNNNRFADAARVPTTPHGGSQTTRGADVEPGEPLPCGAMGATVWHKWVAPGSGRVTVDTFNSGYDTVLAVHVGTRLPTLTTLGCSDDADGSRWSRVAFDATAGVTYLLQVGGKAGASGVAQLNLQCAGCTAPPVHDDVKTAKPILSSGFADRVGTAAATRAGNEPQPCGHVGATVWYVLRPTLAARVYVDTHGSDYDTVLAAYEGKPRLRSLVSCNDDIAAGYEVRSQVVFDVVPGRTYYVQAGGFDGRSGALQLNVLCATPCMEGASNDMRRDATRIPGAPWSLTQSTLGFTEEPGEPLAPTLVGATAWFTYAAPPAGLPRTVTVDTTTSSFNTVLAVYVDGAYVPLGANDDTDGLGRQSRVSFTALPGVTYMVQAGGRFNGYAETGALVLNVR